MFVRLWAQLGILALVAWQVGSQSYDEDYAKKMLILSAGAYAPEPEPCVKMVLPEEGDKWTLVTSYSNGCDNFGGMCHYYSIASEPKKQLIIVFRGTQTEQQLGIEGIQAAADKANDFNGQGKANPYFSDALEKLWKSIEDVLKDTKYISYSVTFTGHSLGGALAGLAALRTVALKLRDTPQVRLYTFGEPRNGDYTLAMNHDKLVPDSWRIVHKEDIVAHLAPCSQTYKVLPLGLGIFKELIDGDIEDKDCKAGNKSRAYHHKTEVWYSDGMPDAFSGDKGNYKECTGDPKNEDVTCSNKIEFELKKIGTYMDDHRHYFNHKVPPFGILGCPKDKKQDEENLVYEAKDENGPNKP